MNLETLRAELVKDFAEALDAALLGCIEDDRESFFHKSLSRAFLNEDRDWTPEEFALVQEVAREELSRRSV